MCVCVCVCVCVRNDEMNGCVCMSQANYVRPHCMGLEYCILCGAGREECVVNENMEVVVSSHFTPTLAAICCCVPMSPICMAR